MHDLSATSAAGDETGPFSPADREAMTLALTLARGAIGLSDPNPRVGCVLTGPDGRILGHGHTQQAGGPHAEVMALRAARDAGHDLRGATAHVTLEPCSHHGRTPPCADALVQAGVARVVAAVLDPNPQVAGRGMARLREAGIATAHGLGADEARELNLGFFSRMLRGRPWVRMKVAASLDGRTALPDGRSRWITGAPARADGHAWRRRAGAVLTGLGTALADDPRLDVREVPTARQPMRVVLDARLDLPAHARVLAPPGEVHLVHVAGAPARPDLAAMPGVTLHRVGRDAAGRPDWAEVLAMLGTLGVNELHVEAGARLNATLVAGGWMDELLLYLAPMLVGDGRGLADLGTLAGLDQAPRLRLGGVARIGEDLRLTARPPGAVAGWLAGHRDLDTGPDGRPI